MKSKENKIKKLKIAAIIFSFVFNLGYIAKAKNQNITINNVENIKYEKYNNKDDKKLANGKKEEIIGKNLALQGVNKKRKYNINQNINLEEKNKMLGNALRKVMKKIYNNNINNTQENKVKKRYKEEVKKLLYNKNNNMQNRKIVQNSLENIYNYKPEQKKNLDNDMVQNKFEKIKINQKKTKQKTSKYYNFSNNIKKGQNTNLFMNSVKFV